MDLPAFPPETSSSGTVRDHLVVVGQRAGAETSELTVHAARFAPPPAGKDLHAGIQDLLDWMSRGKSTREIDPVVAAALAHYQFETLHPFNDGQRPHREAADRPAPAATGGAVGAGPDGLAVVRIKEKRILRPPSRG